MTHSTPGTIPNPSSAAQLQIANRKLQIPKGFTLSELLVVIAIIAVLMSLLMPTVGRVRQSAMSIQCQSNLRQYGLANQNYVNENEGWCAPIFLGYPGATGNRVAWYNCSSFLEVIQTGPISLNWWKSLKVQCPAVTVGLNRMSVGDLYSDYQSVFYGPNTTGVAQIPIPGYPGYPNVYQVVRLSRVKNPPQKFYYMDCQGAAISYSYSSYSTWAVWGENYSISTNRCLVSYRHGNRDRVNILFYDGHVENLHYSEVEALSTASPNYIQWDAYK